MIPSIFAFRRESKEIANIHNACAASNNLTGAHDARPKSAMNTSYILMLATWAGKVFASLIKLSSLSNTKLGNNLCLKTLLYEHQFSDIFLLIVYSALFHDYGSRLYYKKIIAGQSFLFCFNHLLPKIKIYLYKYKEFSYSISFLIFASGGFNRYIYIYLSDFICL